MSTLWTPVGAASVDPTYHNTVYVNPTTIGDLMVVIMIFAQGYYATPGDGYPFGGGVAVWNVGSIMENYDWSNVCSQIAWGRVTTIGPALLSIYTAPNGGGSLGYTDGMAIQEFNFSGIQPSVQYQNNIFNNYLGASGSPGPGVYSDGTPPANIWGPDQLYVGGGVVASPAGGATPGYVYTNNGAMQLVYCLDLGNAATASPVWTSGGSQLALMNSMIFGPPKQNQQVVMSP